eukprot:scaffold240_cov243-Pinguiococcus_pyrenoidosus.AAC.3
MELITAKSIIFVDEATSGAVLCSPTARVTVNSTHEESQDLTRKRPRTSRNFSASSQEGT